MTAGLPGEGGWHRLHPLSPLVRSGRGVIAVLALVGISTSGAVGRSGGSAWYDLAVPVVVALAAVIHWLVTRWKVDGVTLRIETGLLRRDSRQLPIARIQAVDLVRPFLARMLGLAELRVRLAGTGDADGRLAYLTEPAAVALRARLLAAHHGLDPATPEPGERIVVTVPTGRLVGSVIVSLAGFGALAVAAAVVLVALLPLGPLAAAGPIAWWLIICASLVWQRVSSQYGFTVAESPDGLRIRRGLLGTVAETIPLARVQAVRVIEPLLWRPFHWLRLEVDVAGHPGRDRAEGSASRRKALLAVGHPDHAQLLAEIALGPRMPALAPPPRRACWKAPLSYHFLAAGHDDTLAAAVIGRVRKVTSWIPLSKAQSVRYVQGPVQRRLGLATVVLDAAGRHAHARFAERSAGEARQLVGDLAALSRSARRQAPATAVAPAPAGVARPAPACAAQPAAPASAAQPAAPASAAQSG